MPFRHALLALLIVMIWGFNFIFIKLGLQEISPLTLCTVRFFFACFPAIFFIKRPKAPFKLIALYGLFTFAFQFLLLFMGMNAGVTPGITALLMQTQVFFSLFFAMLFLNETLSVWQITGALVSFTGIGVVAEHLDAGLTLSGFLLVIASASSWGMGNLIAKKITNVNMFSLVIWGNFVSCFPLLLLMLFYEGPDHLIATLQNVSELSLISVVYIVYAATWVGYGIWNWLLSRHPMATVAPFALLVPIFASLSSTLILDEPLPLWKLMAGILVIAGLCINLLGTRISIRRRLTIEAAEITSQ